METLKLTNEQDRFLAKKGAMSETDVRSLDVEALVDTGATMLVLPADLCERLGLEIQGYRQVRYANGQSGKIPWVAYVGVELLGRRMVCDALVEAAGTTPLIGQIPLEELDLQVHPKSRRLQVNPESPDIPLLDLLRAG